MHDARAARLLRLEVRIGACDASCAHARKEAPSKGVLKLWTCTVGPPGQHNPIRCSSFSGLVTDTSIGYLVRIEHRRMRQSVKKEKMANSDSPCTVPLSK
jgi:hypothetical protein